MKRHIAYFIGKNRIVTKRRLFVVISLVNVLFFLNILTNTVSVPRTRLAGHDIGLKTKFATRSYLSRMYETPIRLTIHDHTYDISYERMGIYFDIDSALDTIFEPNNRGLLVSMNDFVKHIFYPRDVSIPLSFSQEFYDFVDKINESSAMGTDIVYIDQEHKQATLYETKTRYSVDSNVLKELLQNNFGSQQLLVSVPVTQQPSALNWNVEVINSRLREIFDDPITLIINLKGVNHFIPLDTDDLTYYFSAGVSLATNDITVTLNRQLFEPALADALSQFDETINTQGVYEKVDRGLTNSLLMRTRGHLVDSVKVTIDSGPNTDGSISLRYIEVDISQQKLFTFENGTLLKTYRVSTGKDYPTPVGEFEILNKSGLGFSKIYNVWMPYWMGFEYSKELRAYFGIHELPYFYTGDQKIQRPREFIGAPNTGGCVALDIGDAKEVYQFADIGTQVVIFQ